jgi:hypothetical protein
MFRSRRWALATVGCVALGLLSASPRLLAQSTPTPAAQVEKPCSAPEYRQFDFWQGTWDVTADGKIAGRNAITSIQGGCALLEQWTGAEGGTGTSLNMYDRATEQWHQTWIGSNGTALFLKGGLQDEVMVLESDPVPARAGGLVVHRISWSRLGEGKVRQFWQVSRDERKTWTPVFDGVYAPRP